MATIKIKNKRQLDATRAADNAVLVHRARKAREAESVLDRPTPEQIERFSVGGCGTGCERTCANPLAVHRPASINDCYHEVADKYGCPLKATAGGRLSVDGLGRIEFIVQPTQSNYFLPVFARLSARARDDPDQLLVWRLTAVMVNHHPQENYHVPNPTAATLQGVESTAYDGKTAGDVPGWEVAWGPFSREAQAHHLTLVGFNPYPPGTFMNARATLWGYEIPGLPVGWVCGFHPGCRPKAPDNDPPPVDAQPTGAYVAPPHTRPM
ncbi:MAG: hypothetical protein K0V04_07680 [Deltaproteobacteria bacterium]|nr:hypothetical protein [Deltaproteobacteria bacterium]